VVTGHGDKDDPAKVKALVDACRLITDIVSVYPVNVCLKGEFTLDSMREIGGSLHPTYVDLSSSSSSMDLLEVCDRSRVAHVRARFGPFDRSSAHAVKRLLKLVSNTCKRYEFVDFDLSFDARAVIHELAEYVSQHSPVLVLDSPINPSDEVLGALELVVAAVVVLNPKRSQHGQLLPQ
jgi:hypothetical protein